MYFIKGDLEVEWARSAAGQRYPAPVLELFPPQVAIHQTQPAERLNFLTRSSAGIGATRPCTTVVSAGCLQRANTIRSLRHATVNSCNVVYARARQVHVHYLNREQLIKYALQEKRQRDARCLWWPLHKPQCKHCLVGHTRVAKPIAAASFPCTHVPMH